MFCHRQLKPLFRRPGAPLRSLVHPETRGGHDILSSFRALRKNVILPIGCSVHPRYPEPEVCTVQFAPGVPSRQKEIISAGLQSKSATAPRLIIPTDPTGAN